MSKAKLIEIGGKYVGTRMKDVLKKIRRRQSTVKSRKNAEKLGLGTKSVKRYQNVASSGSTDKSAIVPVKAQTRRGSSFKRHTLRGKGKSQYQVNREGTEGSYESWRSDMERLTTMPTQTQIERLLFKKKRKAKGGMLKLKRGGDNMPARNKKNFRPTEKGAGMTRAGVAAYRRANPGSKLKTAVTGKVKAGSKAAKRRKSFCARSAGQMKKFPKAAADPNSRLRQARRRWKC
tara:strand:- start:57 stop:755 length:699 start_codon:yes stop_codon:yes gene_type:complete